MRALITGASGLVGYQIALGLRRRGWDVTPMGRGATLPYALGDHVELPAAEMLVHCAFDHVPGQYRGGEGNDPEGFKQRNLDGSVKLFEDAKAAGVARVVFLSSRAVYGAKGSGVILTEDTPPTPETLYGQVKLKAEQMLTALQSANFQTYALRATGVYGPSPPGKPQKWADLFAAFAAGHSIAPRVGTEVHGDDLAAAIDLFKDAQSGTYNASDIVLDRADLLCEVVQITGCKNALPAYADAANLNVMNTDRLRSLGWKPRGTEGLKQFLQQAIVAH